MSRTIRKKGVPKRVKEYVRIINMIPGGIQAKEIGDWRVNYIPSALEGNSRTTDHQLGKKRVKRECVRAARIQNKKVIKDSLNEAA